MQIGVHELSFNYIKGRINKQSCTAWKTRERMPELVVFLYQAHAYPIKHKHNAQRHRFHFDALSLTYSNTGELFDNTD